MTQVWCYFGALVWNGMLSLFVFYNVFVLEFFPCNLFKQQRNNTNA